MLIQMICPTATQNDSCSISAQRWLTEVPFLVPLTAAGLCRIAPVPYLYRCISSAASAGLPASLGRGPAVAGTPILRHIRGVQNEIAHADAVLRPSGSSPAWLHAVTTGIAFLVAFVALEWVSFIHEYKGLPVTPWNPGLGVVFALMLYSGARYGIVLFVGVLVAEIAVLRTNLPWPFIIGVATIIATGYSTVAFLIRRHLDVGLNHLRDVLLLLAAGAAGALLVALFLSLLLIADEKLSLADVFVASGPLLVGDAIGIAVVTPLVLRFILHIPHVTLRTLRAFAPEVALYVTVVLLFLWFIGLTESESGFKLFYLFFLPVVVAAIRYGLDGACLGLALTQLGLVGLLHLHGYDANVFTEFQILMLVLTATGLTVGVTVNERQQADRAVREVEALLRANEAEADQAARFNLVSSMASALAHEINQPITAARALGRAAQHLLHNDSGSQARVDDNLTTMIAQIDHAASVVKRMREFLRRGEPHISTINVRALIDDAIVLVGAEAAGAAHPCRGRRVSRSADDARGPCAIAAGHPQSGAELDRRDRHRRARRWAHPGHRCRPRRPSARRNRDLRQWRRHRTGAGGAAVRAAYHLQAGRPGPGPVDLRDNRAVASRPALATIRRARRNRIPILAPSPTGHRFMTAVFVIDDQNSVRHALGEMLRVFGFTVEIFELRGPVPANRRSRPSPDALSRTSACPAWTGSSWCANWPAARSRCRWC